MKFRKINETTVNCIITQEDLEKHGINLEDLFDRKKNAVEFIRKIITKAAITAKLSLKNDYTSMRISVLPDRSVSLTISQDPAESRRIMEQKGIASPEEFGPGPGAGHYGPVFEEHSLRHTPKADRDAMNPGTYVFQFSSLIDILPCSNILARCRGLKSSLYYVKENGFYYLVIEKGEEAGEDYEGTVLKIIEFAKMMSCSDTTLAYMREHSECVIESGAVQQISELLN